jgi:hypothetical protein
MRQLLETLRGERVYLNTTQGHTYSGVLDEVLDEVVRLIAPNGTTPLHVSIADVSGVRLYDQEVEVRP